MRKKIRLLLPCLIAISLSACSQKETNEGGSKMDKRFYFIISGEKTTAEELWGFTELLDPSKI